MLPSHAFSTMQAYSGSFDRTHARKVAVEFINESLSNTRAPGNILCISPCPQLKKEIIFCVSGGYRYPNGTRCADRQAPPPKENSEGLYCQGATCSPENKWSRSSTCSMFEENPLIHAKIVERHRITVAYPNVYPHPIRRPATCFSPGCLSDRPCPGMFVNAVPFSSRLEFRDAKTKTCPPPNRFPKGCRIQDQS